MTIALFSQRLSLREYSMTSGLADVYSPPTKQPTTKRSAMKMTTEAPPSAA